MSTTSPPISSRIKVRQHRARLRPIQIGVPDTRAPVFRAEAHRQSAAIAASSHAADDQAFINSLADLPPE